MTTIQVHEQHGAAGASPRRPRMAWWRAPFSADTWRRTLYVLLVAPVSVVSVPLVLIGGHRTAARWQRGLARRYLGEWIGEPASAGTAARTIAHALLSLPISLGSLALGVYLWSIVPMNLAYPLRPGTMDSYQHSWGGPTLGGACGGRAGDAVGGAVVRPGRGGVAGAAGAAPARHGPVGLVRWPGSVRIT